MRREVREWDISFRFRSVLFALCDGSGYTKFPISYLTPPSLDDDGLDNRLSTAVEYNDPLQSPFLEVGTRSWSVELDTKQRKEETAQRQQK